MKKHERTHTGEKPFACSKCDFTCIQQNDLDRHVKIGKHGRPCEEPGCTFRSGNEQAHQVHKRKAHSAKFHLQCALCDFCTDRPDHMERHRVMHTGEKPFACSFPGCEARFTRKCHAKRHEKKQHGGGGGAAAAATRVAAAAPLRVPTAASQPTNSSIAVAGTTTHLLLMRCLLQRHAVRWCGRASCCVRH
jgi:hypothetical protein